MFAGAGSKPQSDLCAHLGWSSAPNADAPGATAAAAGLFAVGGVAATTSATTTTTTTTTTAAAAAPTTPMPTSPLTVVAHVTGLGCASVDWVVAEWLSVWLRAPPPPTSTTSPAAKPAAAVASPPPRRVVVLVSATHSYPHYFTVARKLGCNLQTASQAGAFVFVDLLAAPHTAAVVASAPASASTGTSVAEAKAAAGAAAGTVSSGAAAAGASTLSSPSASLASATAALSFPALYQRLAQLAAGAASVCIAVDGLSLLSAANTTADALDFVSAVQRLASAGAGGAVLVCGEGTVLTGSNSGADSLHDPLLAHVAHSANTLLSVAPLASGTSSDVHGQVHVVQQHVRGPGAGTLAEAPRLLHYKVQEQSVKVFTRGKAF